MQLPDIGREVEGITGRCDVDEQTGRSYAFSVAVPLVMDVAKQIEMGYLRST